MSVKVYLGADHGGFELKEEAKLWLDEWGYEIEDLGAYNHNPEDDYPPVALAVAQEVVAESGEALGLLFCRSGGGMVVAANKVDGVRAVSLESVEAAMHAKTDNDANVGSLAADWLSREQARVVIKAFLQTEFSGAERHVRRLAQISEFEAQKKA